MAVAARRPRLALWIAWVAATAIGQSIALAAASTGQTEFQGDVGAWIWSAVDSLPVALLQFAALRWVFDISRGRAALWAGATVLVGIGTPAAYSAWFNIVAPRVPCCAAFEQTVVIDAPDYFYSLLLGLVQGIVLAIIVRRPFVAFIWVATSLVAWVVTVYVTGNAMSMSGINFQTAPGGMALPELVLWAIYGAITGSVLVALTMRWPLTAPAPAAR